MIFEDEHIELINQYERSATEIEKAIFVNKNKMNETHYSLLATQSISILYSYWEGFVQRSFQLYIDYLNELGMDFIDFSDAIVVYILESEFKQFQMPPQDFKKKFCFYKELGNFFSSKKCEIFRNVDTESNVGFKVLNKLLEQFSLEKFPEHWDKYTHPRKNLKSMLDDFLRYRNAIAHGGDVSSEEKITKEVYEKYRIMVMDLMYELHNKFLFGINNKTFLKR